MINNTFDDNKFLFEYIFYKCWSLSFVGEDSVMNLFVQNQEGGDKGKDYDYTRNKSIKFDDFM